MDCWNADKADNADCFLSLRNHPPDPSHPRSCLSSVSVKAGTGRSDKTKLFVKILPANFITYIFVVLMKFFACILSIYILVLTAMPCCDRPDEGALQKTEISPKTSDIPCSDIDFCSPFCTCNCCSSPKIQQETVVAFDSTPVEHKYFAALIVKLVTSVIVPVWQPPRLN